MATAMGEHLFFMETIMQELVWDTASSMKSNTALVFEYEPRNSTVYSDTSLTALYFIWD